MIMIASKKSQFNDHKSYCSDLQQCPEPDFVGCTAPDPSNFEDECPTVGEPCDTGNGEYCCLDACPRNFCTAKEGRDTGV